jgi:(p)ppGpp synthase/HD superfamily hydrolase
MKRKHVGIRQVYDARAMRVIVGDKDGALHGPAVRSCYSILDIVHRFLVNLIIYPELPMSTRSRHAKICYLTK